MAGRVFRVLADVPFEVRNPGVKLPQMNPGKAALAAGCVIVGGERRVTVPRSGRILIRQQFAGGDGDQPLHVCPLRVQLRRARQQTEGGFRLPQSAAGKRQAVKRVHIARLLPNRSLQNVARAFVVAGVDGHHAKVVEHLEIGRVGRHGLRKKCFRVVKLPGFCERPADGGTHLRVLLRGRS